MKRFSKIISLGLSAIMAASLTVLGTGFAKAGTAAKGPDISKSVELTMYLIGSPGKDYDAMLSILNKKMKKDINATVKVNWIGWGDFGTKYPLILASGEPIDLIYTATWLNYYSQAQKGAFMPLEKIGPKYAPKSFAAEPKEGLKQATIDGHIYALPPNYTNYSTYGPIIRGDLMQKYGIKSVKTLDDYGKFMDVIAKNEKGLDPSGMYATQTPMDGLYFYSKGLYPLSGDIATQSPFWINFSDPSGKVVNIVERADMPSFLKKMKTWSDKGYWPKSVLSNKDNQMLTEGKSASFIHLMDGWITDSINYPQYKVVYANMIPHSFPLPYMQDGMAVPSSAKNPERALMLLEKLRTDESYYNLMTYGIEGKNFEITKDKKLKLLDQTGFIAEQYCSWGFRDNKFKLDLVGSPSNLQTVRNQLAANAKKNIYTMFNFNTDPVKNEYAAVLNVMQQYYVPLKLGYVDPVSGLSTLKEKLKAAGVDKVQTELQKQLDAFRSQNK